MGSKSKKRVILPTRPDPPTVDQILEDVGRASPSDPVFTMFQDCSQDRGTAAEGEVESRYQQSRRYLERIEQLQEAQAQLAARRGELCLAGERLEQTVAEVRGRAL
ncbi:CS025 protein, partial [Atractosteus spatula]|nr:CS025 protein [Atractosteus spatula]